MIAARVLSAQAGGVERIFYNGGVLNFGRREIGAGVAGLPVVPSVNRKLVGTVKAVARVDLIIAAAFAGA